MAEDPQQREPTIETNETTHPPGDAPGDPIDAHQSQDFINRPPGPLLQTFGPQRNVSTSGGDYAEGNIDKRSFTEVNILNAPAIALEELDNRRRILNNIKGAWSGTLPRDPSKIVQELLQSEEWGQRPVRITPRMELWSGLVRRPGEQILGSTQQQAREVRPSAIIDLFVPDMDRLLVLGAPGSGKTTAMAELLCYLADRTEAYYRAVATGKIAQDRYRIPAIFSMPRWEVSGKPLVKWMADELVDVYHVSPPLAREYVQQGEITPLFDGCDEVSADRLIECFHAINELLIKHNQYNLAPVIVTFDWDEYLNFVDPTGQEKLRLKAALRIRALTPEQIDEYLLRLDQLKADLRNRADSPAHLGEYLNTLDAEGVRLALSNDATLYDLIQTPLMLKIAMVAWASDCVKELLIEHDSERRCTLLWQAYIEARFEQYKGHHPRARLEGWLRWLANHMESHGYSFRLGGLQADWLPSDIARWHYSLLDRLGCGLFAGLCLALLSGLSVLIYEHLSDARRLRSDHLLLDSLVIGLFALLVASLFGGDRGLLKRIDDPRSNFTYRVKCATGCAIAGGLLGKILGGTGGLQFFSLVGALSGFLDGAPGIGPRHIIPYEHLRWSRRKAFWLLPRTIGGGFIAGLMIWLGFDRVAALEGMMLLGVPIGGWQSCVLAGLTVGVLVAMIFGLDRREIPRKITANQALRRSLRNAAVAACFGGIFAGAVGQLIAAGPLHWLIIGSFGALIVGLAHGGYACVSHLTLRLVLSQTGAFPFRAVSFLNEVDKLVLLIPRGDTYEFYHPQLLGYFSKCYEGDEQYQVRARSGMVRSAGILATVVLMLAMGVGWLYSLLSPGPMVAPDEQCNACLNSDMKIWITKAPEMAVPERYFEHRDGKRQVKLTGQQLDRFQLRKGDTVTIQAHAPPKGGLSIGPVVGKVGPDGTERGFLGMPIGDRFDVYTQHRTGALLYRVSSESAWHAYPEDSPATLSVPSDGVLEMIVNDYDTKRHKGYWEVHIVVTHHNRGG